MANKFGTNAACEHYGIKEWHLHCQILNKKRVIMIELNKVYTDGTHLERQ